MSTMTVVEVLVAARALIEDPARWCQNTFATDATGASVMPARPEACRWCALGVLDAVLLRAGIKEDEQGEPWATLVQHLDSAAEGYTTLGISSVNDNVGHTAVLACYDTAIAAARAAEAEGQVSA